VGLGYVREEPHRHEALRKYIVDHGLCLKVGKPPLLERSDLRGEAAKMVLEPNDRLGEFHPEVEAGGVLALESDQIASKRKVVTHKNREPGADLERQGFVIAGAQAEGGDAIAGLAVGKLQDAQGDGAGPAESERLLA